MIAENRIPQPLPNLPALYADLYLVQKHYQEKLGELSKLYNMGDRDEVEGRRKYNEIDREGEAENDKRKDEIEAERKRIKEKSVPFTCSDAFEQLNFKVTSAKLNSEDFEDLAISLTVVAKQDFEVNSDNRQNYENICCLFVAKDGSIINLEYTNVFNYQRAISFTKDQSMVGKRKGILDATQIFDPSYKAYIFLSLQYFPECLVNFAGIKFITLDEISNVETCVSRKNSKQ